MLEVNINRLEFFTIIVSNVSKNLFYDGNLKEILRKSIILKYVHFIKLVKEIYFLPLPNVMIMIIPFLGSINCFKIF